MRKRFRGNQAAIMVGKHERSSTVAYSTLLIGQRVAGEEKGRGRQCAVTHMCRMAGDDGCRSNTRNPWGGRSLINPTVLPSLVPHCHPFPTALYLFHSVTIIRPTVILGNVVMSSAATTTASSAVPSLAAPLKSLPPAKEIPQTFVAGIKSWWEAGTSASEHAEGRLLQYVPTICPFRPRGS